MHFVVKLCWSGKTRLLWLCGCLMHRGGAAGTTGGNFSQQAGVGFDTFQKKIEKLIIFYAHQILISPTNKIPLEQVEQISQQAAVPC